MFQFVLLSWTIGKKATLRGFFLPHERKFESVWRGNNDVKWNWGQINGNLFSWKLKLKNLSFIVIVGIRRWKYMCLNMASAISKRSNLHVAVMLSGIYVYSSTDVRFPVTKMRHKLLSQTQFNLLCQMQ